MSLSRLITVTCLFCVSLCCELSHTCGYSLQTHGYIERNLLDSGNSYISLSLICSLIFLSIHTSGVLEEWLLRKTKTELKWLTLSDYNRRRPDIHKCMNRTVCVGRGFLFIWIFNNQVFLITIKTYSVLCHNFLLS